MSNPDQLKLLKQSIEAWNNWREENSELEIDLKHADLRGCILNTAILSKALLQEAHLEGAYLEGTNLEEAHLEGAHLEGTHLRAAIFKGAHLEGACLEVASFKGANLRDAHLEGANLEEADLTGADFKGANLERAFLEGANLMHADLKGTNLMEADLNGAFLGRTGLGDLDLSDTKGLETVVHNTPSPLSTSTLERSKGGIPEKFLRGCGLSDWEIESSKLYRPGLTRQHVNDIIYRIYDLRAGQAIQINPLFISYTHSDGEFVNEMEQHLDKKGIRFWRDIHDAPAGPLEQIVDRAMRLNPTVLLILSERSVESDWVEHEAESARELEKELNRHVLCPVALDEAWKDCAWEQRLRRQIMKYNILDFSKWKDKREFTEMFRRLIDGLDLFYKDEEHQ